MHNGGPCGHTRNTTQRYEDKIAACLTRKGLGGCLYSTGGTNNTSIVEGTTLQNAIRVNSYY
jgi:hypothetical protein